MKKYFALIFSALLIQFCCAQVSITTDGTPPTDPKSMLEVKKASYSKLKIRSMSFATDTTALELSNRTGPTGTDFLLSSIREEGLFLTTLSDFGPNIKDSFMAFKPVTGYIGMGIRNPSYNLHLHSPGMTTSYMSITNNTSGHGIADGLIMGLTSNNAVIANVENGYLRLGTNNFTRIAIDANGLVGVGNLTPAYRLDVNGDANITGTLRINGSPGVSGQVLTSNGASDPTWSPTALSNTVRFGVDMVKTSASGSGPLAINANYYNTNTTAITIGGIGTTDIIFNQTGLYHLNGNFSGLVQGSGFTYTPEYTSNLVFTGGTSFTYQLTTWKPLVLRGAVNNNWYHIDQFSMELYILAGTTLQISRSFLTNPAATYHEANCTIFGHLISQ